MGGYGDGKRKNPFFADTKMATVNTTNITTAEQLLELPDDFGPCELVRGELTMMTPAGSRHGRAEARLLSRIEAFADKQELGSVFPSDSGFLLERNQDTVRCPDVAFVCAARMPAEPIDGFFPGPPDLAVEIRSSSTRLPDVLAKISHYLETGVKVVWDVDPETQTVTIYRAAGTVETYSGDATLTEPELLPGFSIALKEIFVW